MSSRRPRRRTGDRFNWSSAGVWGLYAFLILHSLKWLIGGD